MILREANLRDFLNYSTLPEGVRVVLSSSSSLKLDYLL